MKYTVSEFSELFRTHVGDGTADIPDKFIIASLNWAFNELPLVPKLSKIFSKHKQVQLDAKDHYKWNLSKDFRRLIDIPMLNFWTSTGGKPCRLNLCNRDNVEFYNKNGIISMKESGQPCEYTIEQEDDNIWLVLDRPSDVPIMLDYIAYGFPKPVKSMEDVIEVSAIAENLIIDAMRVVYYHEADDFAFASDIGQYLDNKKVLEAIQALHKRFGIDDQIIVGEV